MTEKRFTLKDDVGMLDVACANIFDNGEFIGTVPLFDAEKFVDLLNELYEEKEQLLSDKEHLMGCLIRFFGYDDEDIDYNLNRESNREYGKAYYSMKEETEKEL